MTKLDELVRLLKKLPGMGEKTASRLAYHLLETNDSYNKSLGELISTLQESIHPCPKCLSYMEGDYCPYCDDAKRDRTILCVVEKAQDTASLSSAGIYNGLFHVLGGAIDPLNGIGPDKLSFALLKKRVEEGNIKEVIIATNPTECGDTTALYIRELLSSYPIKLSRLASGMPIGGDLGYVDKTTLLRSLRGRVSF